MKLKAFAIAALLMAPQPFAVAQQADARAAAGNKIFDWCKRLPTGTVANAAV